MAVPGVIVPSLFRMLNNSSYFGCDNFVKHSSHGEWARAQTNKKREKECFFLVILDLRIVMF
ncbi:hypothetical protein BU25DRAFT_71983 [Macroventuria anomochaeta]|uniref:Uncharacterized protein n=1 Tax=Macroventuria anomochaeta TaxID=301207 RepID=A0ACB6RXT2_9PLEO|nr:uncharacterized protein BU25DRAFT_71983 [Macroventuria anomochaeta]KAF2626790.1 hypothetical protein BU25DRAFT_71983 [Macroventuria anomochaeta]